MSHEKHEPAVKLGPIELPAQAKQTAIVSGGLMLVLGGKQ